MRKRRTRNHIIADLSINHFERHVLLCGYSVERIRFDYGIDLLLCTYTVEGEVESETVKIQAKATDSLTVLKDGETIAFTILSADLEFWIAEWLPVILIVYDAQNQEAYWLYIQAYFQAQASSGPTISSETVTLRIPKANIVNEEAIRRFARFKADVIRQKPGETKYELHPEL